MRKPVRGALQGCPSKGLAASQQNPPAPNTAALFFLTASLQRSRLCVRWAGGVGGGGGGVELLLFRLYNLFYSSTYHISGSDGLIIPHTVTNGECDRAPYLLSYIFTKFVPVHDVA